MTTNKMHLFMICLFLVCCTCFGRLFRPSSGAHNCIYSFKYCPPILLQTCIVDEMELIHDTSHQQYRWTILEAVYIVCAPDDGRKSRPKHVQQTRNKQIINRCILLVVMYNKTTDARHMKGK
jgi:hypothetical protein